MAMEDLKQKVVQCCQLLRMTGLIQEGGHVSARIPGTDRILIHPRDVSRLAVSAKHILTVDLNGNLIEGDDRPPSELPIHTSIYRVRADVQSVAHLHSHYATVFSTTDKKLLPICKSAVAFAQGVPLWPSSVLVDTSEKGEAVARTLGRARAVLLQGHGSVVVAGSVEEVFVTSLHLEETARMQYEASLLGEFKLLSQSDIEECLSRGETPRANRKVWDYYGSLAQKEGLW